VAPATLTNQQASLRREGKLVLSMVGLPARGKTAIARTLRRHLTWQGYKTEIFNVGNYRRKHLGASQPAAFFDPANSEASGARHEMAQLALDDLVRALAEDSLDIAIFDATNTTLERRRWLQRSLAVAGARLGTRFQLVFIESVCSDDEIIRSNVQETKLKMPDYRDADAAAAVDDFLQRIAFYAQAYEPLCDAAEGDLPYIKLIDVGRQIIANRINGNLNSRIMFFLSNLHITPRPIWLSRHGESEFNVAGRIGGDSLLSPRGYAYALKLGAFMRAQYPEAAAAASAGGGAGASAGGAASPPAADLVIWTSLLRRTVATAATVGREIVRWNELNEIDAGVCDGMTYEQIAATMPDEYAARGKNKYRYRYPRGESYEDIAQRLEPVIIELMRTKSPVLIVSHQATLRVLYAYLTDKAPEACPEELIPLHTVIQLTPRAYGCDEVRHTMQD
jgi:broad specificity phosphatase PhoE